jgi:putative ABC transport system substrate-binding protein
MHFVPLKRRELITLVCAAAVLPLTARAQPVMPLIGFLQSLSQQARGPEIAAFHSGLRELGYVEGQNVRIEYRFADGQFDRLPALVADLVESRVNVLLAGTNISARAAIAATRTIPIVFTAAGDPVRLGFVANLNKPGANVTGVTNLANILMEKNLELLHHLVPVDAVIGYLVNPDNPNADTDLQNVEAAARTLARSLLVVRVRNDRELEPAFATFAEQHVGALLVGADPLFIQLRDRLIERVARAGLPATYPLPEFAAAGGLMSYASNNREANRLAGTYVGRILKGEKAGDLPVQQAVKIELTINLKTAKALGLTFPLPLLGRADEVIE